MQVMDETQLNEFSRRFAAVLFASRPDWRGLASVDSSPDVDKGSLLVEVFPTQRRDLKSPLFISTDRAEITVGFDAYHEHFNRYAEDNEEQAFREALALIADILQEKVAMVSWWDGDKWCGSCRMNAGEDVGALNVGMTGTLRIRSWSATYDRDSVV